MSDKRIEDTMREALSGDALKHALDFAEFLNANGMVVNGAEVSYNGKVVCYMHLEKGQDYPSPWTIWTDGGYSCEHEDVPMDEHLKEIAWANINKCGNCGSKCAPGTRKTIFGKAFDDVCSADMAFYVPDAKTQECVKKLLMMRTLQ